MSRPRPPKLQDPIKGTMPDGISPRDVAAVIAWARAWGDHHPIETNDHLVAAVRAMATEGRLKRAEWSVEAEAVATIALKRLNFCAQMERMRRTKDVMPGVLFLTHLDPCAAAKAKDGTVSLRAPDMPLAKCDAAHCRCHLRQLSMTEYAARKAKK